MAPNVSSHFNIGLILGLIMFWISIGVQYALGEAVPVYHDRSIRAARCPKPSGRGLRTVLQNSKTVAYFKCKKKFFHLGTKISTCEPDGSWNPPPPTCIVSGCTRFRPTANLIDEYKHQGAMVEFQCGPGYEIVGSSVITCNGKKWSGRPPTCKEVPTTTTTTTERPLPTTSTTMQAITSTQETTMETTTTTATTTTTSETTATTMVKQTTPPITTQVESTEPPKATPKPTTPSPRTTYTIAVQGYTAPEANTGMPMTTSTLDEVDTQSWNNETRTDANDNLDETPSTSEEGIEATTDDSTMDSTEKPEVLKSTSGIPSAHDKKGAEMTTQIQHMTMYYESPSSNKKKDAGLTTQSVRTIKVTWIPIPLSTTRKSQHLSKKPNKSTKQPKDKNYDQVTTVADIGATVTKHHNDAEFIGLLVTIIVVCCGIVAAVVWIILWCYKRRRQEYYPPKEESMSIPYTDNRGTIKDDELLEITI